jgi:hypothetical protein
MFYIMSPFSQEKTDKIEVANPKYFHIRLKKEKQLWKSNYTMWGG